MSIRKNYKVDIEEDLFVAPSKLNLTVMRSQKKSSFGESAHAKEEGLQDQSIFGSLTIV